MVFPYTVQWKHKVKHRLSYSFIKLISFKRIELGQQKSLIPGVPDSIVTGEPWIREQAGLSAKCESVEEDQEIKHLWNVWVRHEAVSFFSFNIFPIKLNNVSYSSIYCGLFIKNK